MRRLPRLGLVGTIFLVAVAAAISGSALAYFSGHGLGSAAAAVSKLSAPTITAATPAVGGTVALTWGGVSAPGTGAVTYYVTRDGEEAAGTCPASSAPAAVTSCTDSGLDPGSHSYRVTAVWRSWSATSSTSAAKVTIGAATHFAIAAASLTPAVSVADNLTITAEDASENAVTSYTGSHSLVFSGASPSPNGNAPTVANSAGTAVAFGSATALTFTAGVAKVSASKNGLLKIYRGGEAEIAASEGALETTAPLVLTVTPGAATKFTLAADTTTPVAGIPDDLTITAVDTYGNAATAYTGSHKIVFSGASASPGGTAPTVSSSAGTEIAFGTATPIVFSAGVATASGGANGEMTLYKSATANIKATEGTLTNSTALATTTAAGPAAKLVLAGATTTPVAAASDNLTITAQDVYANTVTAYEEAEELTFSGASASPDGTVPTVVDSAGTAIPFGSPTALTFTAGVAKVSAAKNGLMRLSAAGATSVTVSDGSISTAAPVVFTVAVGTAAKVALSGVTVSAGSIGSPCFFTCAVTGLGNGGTIAAKVSVTDSVGNTISKLGSGHSVKVTASGGTIVGGTLAIPATGAAVSSTAFTYTAPVSGAFANTITAAATGYASATVTAGK